MYTIRDTFYLQFGRYKNVHALIDEAVQKNVLAHGHTVRVLTDFTGAAYRLIFEEDFDTLAAFEQSLTKSFHNEEWQQWYEKVKPFVVSSEREILKRIL